jgi:hypothetical protein
MDRVWYGYELEGWSGCGSDGGCGITELGSATDDFA